jgi:CRISPR system Cascade subunit CasE
MNLYLAALTLNPRSREANRDVLSAGAMHDRLMHLFDTMLEGPGRPLWRIDVIKPGRHVVLVQCAAAPELSRLPAGYATEARCKRIDEMLAGIAAGDTLRFRLRAAPAKTLYEPDARSASGDVPLRPRIALRDEATRVAWLVRKMRDVGAQASSVSALGEGGIKVRGLALYGSVRYDGLLRISDPSLLRNGIATGIGRGKAWGFGLLSLARPE